MKSILTLAVANARSILQADVLSHDMFLSAANIDIKTVDKCTYPTETAFSSLSGIINGDINSQMQNTSVTTPFDTVHFNFCESPLVADSVCTSEAYAHIVNLTTNDCYNLNQPSEASSKPF